MFGVMFCVGEGWEVCIGMKAEATPIFSFPSTSI